MGELPQSPVLPLFFSTLMHQAGLELEAAGICELYLLHWPLGDEKEPLVDKMYRVHQRARQRANQERRNRHAGLI